MGSGAGAEQKEVATQDWTSPSGLKRPWAALLSFKLLVKGLRRARNDPCRKVLGAQKRETALNLMAWPHALPLPHEGLPQLGRDAL